MEVVRYVNQISNLTTDPKTISVFLKAYSDKRYSSGNNYDGELELPTFKEFVKTELELKLQAAYLKAEEAESQKVIEIERMQKAEQATMQKAQEDLASAAAERNNIAAERDALSGTLNTAMQDGVKRHLRSSLIISRVLEVAFAIVAIIIGFLVKDKIHSSVLVIGIVVAIITKILDVFLSSKMGIMKNLWKWLYLKRVKSSDIYHTLATRSDYFECAQSEFNKVSNNNLWSVKLG